MREAEGHWLLFHVADQDQVCRCRSCPSGFISQDRLQGCIDPPHCSQPQNSPKPYGGPDLHGDGDKPKKPSVIYVLPSVRTTPCHLLEWKSGLLGSPALTVQS